MLGRGVEGLFNTVNSANFAFGHSRKLMVLWTGAYTMCAGLGRMTSYLSHTDGAEQGAR